MDFEITVVLNTMLATLALLAVELMVVDNEEICAYCGNEEHMTIVLKLLSIISSVTLLRNPLFDENAYKSTFFDAIVSYAVLCAWQ